MKKLIIFSMALLIAGAVSVRAADAKETWEKSCKLCHGLDGKGKTKMKAFGETLSDDEINALVKYVRAFKK